VHSLRTGSLPRWLAWVSLVVALALIILPIGWAALLFGFPLWVLVVSFLLWSASADTAEASAPR
jgi:type IV secretory pathway TrbD component